MNRRSLLLIAVVLLLAAGGGYVWWKDPFATPPSYRLATIERGSITAAVAATGTLNPVVSVQVGSQVSGQIKELYVDFNSTVKKGQLIARIDPQTGKLLEGLGSAKQSGGIPGRFGVRSDSQVRIQGLLIAALAQVRVADRTPTGIVDLAFQTQRSFEDLTQ